MNTPGTIEDRSFTIPTTHGALHAERWRVDDRVDDARKPIVLFHDSLGCAACVLGAWIDSWLTPGFAHWTLDDDLRRVTCPTLAIHGDEYGSTRHPRRIVERVHGPATLRIMDGVGHVPHRECGEVVLTAVGSWLAPMLA